MIVGVVSIQGDFDQHIQVLRKIGVQTREVRVPSDLSGIDRLILPGGESTTVGLLMQRFGLAEAIQAFAKDDIPIWGTCMGMILMARTILDRPNQFSLNLLDIEVTRNAFGSQINSFEDSVTLEGFPDPILGVFIRAPIVSALGPQVQELGVYQGKVVAVRQGQRIGTSFHPELTDDDQMHRWFLTI